MVIYCVEIKSSNPCDQYLAKKRGKKAAKTVVKKAEFPRSYNIHDFTSMLNLSFLMVVEIIWMTKRLSDMLHFFL